MQSKVYIAAQYQAATSIKRQSGHPERNNYEIKRYNSEMTEWNIVNCKS